MQRARDVSHGFEIRSLMLGVPRVLILPGGEHIGHSKPLVYVDNATPISNFHQQSAQSDDAQIKRTLMFWVLWSPSDHPCTSGALTLQTHYSFDRYPILVYFVSPYTRCRCVGVPWARKVTEISPTGQRWHQLTNAASIKTFLKPIAFMLISYA